MSLYAVVRNSTNVPTEDLVMFYTTELNEAKGYANLIETNQKGTYFWEVFEMPSDFVKPTIRELKVQLRNDIYASPLLYIVGIIKSNAVKKITKEF